MSKVKQSRKRSKAEVMRLVNSAIGYIAPLDKLNGKDSMIFEARDAKLEAARAQRKRLRAQQLEAA